MDKNGDIAEQLGCKDQNLTPDSLTATTKLGDHHVLNTNHRSQDVSDTPVGVDDNMSARKVSGDDFDSDRFSADDDDDNKGFTVDGDDIVSESGDNTKRIW